MRFALPIILSSLLALAATGCGGSSSATASSQSSAAASVDGSKFLLSEEPDDAIGVIAARESAKDGDSIVVVGRIAGAANPWIEGRAAFMLLDASMVIVADGTESVEGEVCLDDCCAAERADATTLVKLVDARGKALAVDTRDLLGVNENDMVVVRGSVSKDDGGKFVVLADGVYIR